MGTQVEEFLATHKTKDLIKVYGPGTMLGEFPPQTVDFDALSFQEKVSLQNKKRSALRVYDGFWVYVLSRVECFEGRLDHTQVRICQIKSVLTKDLVPFSHQVAVSREDYELIHTLSAENIYICDVRFKGLEKLVPYELDLNQSFCSFADTFSNYNEFRLLSIRHYQNDDPDEPDYDWSVLVIIEYQMPPKESSLTHLLQQMQEFWMTQHVDIKNYSSDYKRVSSIVYQV